MQWERFRTGDPERFAFQMQKFRGFNPLKFKDFNAVKFYG